MLNFFISFVEVSLKEVRMGRPRGPCLCTICHTSKHLPLEDAPDISMGFKSRERAGHCMILPSLAKALVWTRSVYRWVSCNPLWTRWIEESLVLQRGTMSSPDHASARGAGVMFWAAIIDNELTGSYKGADGVKMTARVYIHFLKVTWLTGSVET